MCEYQRTAYPDSDKHVVPICAYTKELCTFCVYGNQDTLKKAKQAEKNGEFKEDN